MKMDNDLIVKLINAFPSDGDYEALINSKGDEPVEDWDIPEQYFLQLADIKDLKPKLDVVKFINEY